MNDLRDTCVLITGGTMGIGLATGLAFARQGCRVTLTHKWGTADEDALLAHLRERHEAVEVFVSNVSMALVVKSVDDYVKRSLSS